ncbi:Hypothetical predicted protein [Cloeon dipterum]|uniref:Uncharacterized protein n=1 Tax=Cloeon dipterum TaxID=197152 RepID=A0A8S1CF67_9INSE|nr:Hypothetical predicted protein [Cloeon dipterum]
MDFNTVRKSQKVDMLIFMDSAYDGVEKIIKRLRPTGNSSSFDLVALKKMSQSEREDLIRRLACVNDKEQSENWISKPRLMEILIALVEEPIEHLDFKTARVLIADAHFMALIEKATMKSAESLKTLRLNLINTCFWFTRAGSMTLRLKNIQELRLPSFIFRKVDFDAITANFLSLVVLECILHSSFTRGGVAKMLYRLEKLRTFIFDVADGDYFRIPNRRKEDDRCFSYSRHFALHFPSLNVIGCSDLTITGQQEQFMTRYCHVLNEEDAELLNGASGLQHLIVQRPMHPRQAEWHSESALSLCVVGLVGEKNWLSLNRLRKIKHLYTIDCCPAGPMKTRLQEIMYNDEKMQKHLIREDPEPDNGLFMTINALPAMLDGIRELHFYDLPDNCSRLVDVMTAPGLEIIHITFQNLDKSSLSEALEDLKLRDDVGPNLKSLLVTIQGEFEEKGKKMLVDFIEVVGQKAGADCLAGIILNDYKMSDIDTDNEREHSSLENMCFNIIVKNIGTYKYLLKLKIPPPWRKRLYEEAMRRKMKIGTGQVWTAFPYLEPHKLVVFFSTREVAWLLKLEVKSGQSTKLDFVVSLEEILRYLDLFAPNLQQLCIDDTREIEKLHEIEADRILVEEDATSMKTTLETFDTAFKHQEYKERAFPPKLGIIFKKTDAVEDYRRAQVKYRFSLDSDFLDSIPQITHLGNDCGIFSSQTGCDILELQHILRKVGEHLKDLRICSFQQEPKFTFRHIFEHCKSLESLHLHESYVADDDEPIESFGKLKKLLWNNEHFGFPITLSTILCAPLLQKIEIKSFFCIFDLGDKERLFNRIRSREICTNVRVLTIEDWIIFFPRSKRFTNFFKRHFSTGVSELHILKVLLVFQIKMRHFWAIALISIALSSKINAKSVQQVEVDPFDEKCASLASTNSNWNYQIPVNLTLMPNLNIKNLDTNIEKEHAEWIVKEWEVTKSNASWGTLRPGITLVKGFSLAYAKDSTPFLVMIKEGGIVQSGYPKDSTNSDICSMAMKAADKTIVTLDSYDEMFKPIDEDVAKQVGEHAGDILPVAMSWLMWFLTAVGVIVVISIIGCILWCCFC